MGKFLLGVIFGALAFFVYDRHTDAGVRTPVVAIEDSGASRVGAASGAT